MYYLKNTEMGEPRAIYKAKGADRFYRGTFSGMNKKYWGMKLYTCKSLRRIKAIREHLHSYSKEQFDVYDENGKVEI